MTHPYSISGAVIAFLLIVYFSYKSRGYTFGDHGLLHFGPEPDFDGRAQELDAKVPVVDATVMSFPAAYAAAQGGCGDQKLHFCVAFELTRACQLFANARYTQSLHDKEEDESVRTNYARQIVLSMESAFAALEDALVQSRRLESEARSNAILKAAM